MVKSSESMLLSLYSGDAWGPSSPCRLPRILEFFFLFLVCPSSTFMSCLLLSLPVNLMGMFFQTWESFQWPHHRRKTSFPLPPIISCFLILREGFDLVNLSLYDKMLKDIVFPRTPQLLSAELTSSHVSLENRVPEPSLLLHLVLTFFLLSSLMLTLRE